MKIRLFALALLGISFATQAQHEAAQHRVNRNTLVVQKPRQVTCDDSETAAVAFCLFNTLTPQEAHHGPHHAKQYYQKFLNAHRTYHNGQATPLPFEKHVLSLRLLPPVCDTRQCTMITQHGPPERYIRLNKSNATQLIDLLNTYFRNCGCLEHDPNSPQIEKRIADLGELLCIDRDIHPAQSSNYRLTFPLKLDLSTYFSEQLKQTHQNTRHELRAFIVREDEEYRAYVRRGNKWFEQQTTGVKEIDMSAATTNDTLTFDHVATLLYEPVAQQAEQKQAAPQTNQDTYATPCPLKPSTTNSQLTNTVLTLWHNRATRDACLQYQGSDASRLQLKALMETLQAQPQAQHTVATIQTSATAYQLIEQLCPAHLLSDIMHRTAKNDLSGAFDEKMLHYVNLKTKDLLPSLMISHEPKELKRLLWVEVTCAEDLGAISLQYGLSGKTYTLVSAITDNALFFVEQPGAEYWWHRTVDQAGNVTYTKKHLITLLKDGYIHLPEKPRILVYETTDVAIPQVPVAAPNTDQREQKVRAEQAKPQQQQDNIPQVKANTRTWRNAALACAAVACLGFGLKLWSWWKYPRIA